MRCKEELCVPVTMRKFMFFRCLWRSNSEEGFQTNIITLMLPPELWSNFILKPMKEEWLEHKRMKKFATHELLIKSSAQIQVNISSWRVLYERACGFSASFSFLYVTFIAVVAEKYERRYKNWCLEQIKEISNIWKKPSVIVKNKITLQQKNWGWGKSNNNLLPKVSLTPPNLVNYSIFLL
jgi:hypothetical protein